jgi:hypothetical protein
MITGCSKKDIQKHALSIANRLDNDSVNIFKEWNYTRRGEWGYWYKVSTDETLYSCVYSVEEDTSMLKVMQSGKFFVDFPWNYSLDTAQYRQVVLSKFEDKMKVNTLFYPLIEIGDNLNTNGLFINKDPFDHFSKINSLKNDLHVFGISYRGDIGDFIQFYLSPQHVLTYLPDNAYFNPESKDIWMKEFERGKMIKKNWNLRKLEHPLDNG